MITRTRRKFLDNWDNGNDTRSPLPSCIGCSRLDHVFHPANDRVSSILRRNQASFRGSVCVCTRSMAHFLENGTLGFQYSVYSLSFHFLQSSNGRKRRYFPRLCEMTERLAQFSRLMFPEMQITRYPRSSSRAFRRARNAIKNEFASSIWVSVEIARR